MTTKEKQALIANQVDLHWEIVKEAHINIVNCGNCGSIFLHRTNNEDNVICPFCYENMAKSDCPDYFYTGLEFSGEFEFNNEAEATEIKEKNTTETIYNNTLNCLIYNLNKAVEYTSHVPDKYSPKGSENKIRFEAKNKAIKDVLKITNTFVQEEL